MAGEKRTGVRQAFMKRSFMRSRTTAICDCWLDPLAGARSGFWKAPLTSSDSKLAGYKDCERQAFDSHQGTR